MNELIFSFTGITVRTLNQTLFSDLNFNIHKGQLWALIGPSGSGKTALLETIAGKLHISKGEVRHPFFDQYILEHQITDPLFNWHKLIGQVSSRHHFRSFSNTSNFYYQQRFNSSDSEDVETVENYLLSVKVLSPSHTWTYQKVTERLRLQSLLDKKLIKLSSGETKRLLLAAVLIRNPVLLLLDNPLTGLDADSRKDFIQLISEIAESGISVVMATSPYEIPDAITHIALLENGKILKTQPAAHFKTEHLPLANSQGINTSELKDLLVAHEFHTYHKVVGMENVVIKYGEKVILDHVNWTVGQGERWALLGHNGAGKSTLLSLINGDNPQAYANNIILFDRKRGTGESIWDIKKKIGFVSAELFQYFPSGTSCLQVIESGFYDTLGLFRPSNPNKAAIAGRWMSLLEIGGSAGTLFRNVSASTQRLCLLARALVKNPPLLIFDEPCQGLDTHQQEHFKQIVDGICANSRVTLIYVTHYQNEIPASVTKTLMLAMGKVIPR